MDFLDIYRHEGERYQRMIAAEDFQHNLKSTLTALLPAHPANLLDLGSGTGRLPCLLDDTCGRITALDLHRDMLLQQPSADTLAILQSDMRSLPFEQRQFEVVSAGWAIGHLVGWYASDWQTQVDAVLNEMQRVVLPGGTLLIMETFSTGALQPAPPTSGLAALYTWFEEHWGFQRKVIATDYLFRSVEEACDLTGFFFGEELVQKIKDNNWRRLPEWTGVWCRHAV